MHECYNEDRIELLGECSDELISSDRSQQMKRRDAINCAMGHRF